MKSYNETGPHVFNSNGKLADFSYALPEQTHVKACKNFAVQMYADWLAEHIQTTQDTVSWWRRTARVKCKQQTHAVLHLHEECAYLDTVLSKLGVPASLLMLWHSSESDRLFGLLCDSWACSCKATWNTLSINAAARLAGW